MAGVGFPDEGQRVVDDSGQLKDCLQRPHRKTRVGAAGETPTTPTRTPRERVLLTATFWL
jgi:hypothetical protein